MNVVGVDLSYTGTGIAAGDMIQHFGTSPDWTLESRAEHISHIVKGALDPIDLVVIEGFVTRSPAAAMLGFLHGVVRTDLHRARIPFALVPPATLKKWATGKGNATKADMRMALFKRTGVDLADDNEVDAVWLRMAGQAYCGQLESSRMAVLDAVDWSALGEAAA